MENNQQVHQKNNIHFVVCRRSRWSKYAVDVDPVGDVDPVVEVDPVIKVDPVLVVEIEEHTSELQSLPAISYAVFCL